MSPTQPSQQPSEDALIRRLIIPNRSLLAGEANHVTTILTAENYREFLAANTTKNLYIVGGADPSKGLYRATDGDIHGKNYCFIDIDVREQWKKEGKEISDEEIKELGHWLIGALADHPFLKLWSYISFSGNGLHVWFMGAVAPVMSVDDWKLGMKHIFTEFEKHTKLVPDYSCGNVSKLIRLVGSYNNKNGKHVATEILASQDCWFPMSLVENFGAGLKMRENSAAKTATPISGDIGKGGRNATLTSLAGTLRHRGMDEDTMLALLRAANKQQCKPPLPDEEVRSIAKSVARYSSKEQKNADASVPVVLCLADVQREEVSWLWGNRIPYGKLSIVEGHPGTGKSFCTAAIACAVSLGRPLYGDNEEIEREPARVLLLNAEDGPADTIRPRLEDMGANIKNISVLTAVKDGEGKERHFSLAEDLAALEKVLATGGYRLVVIDPINAYLGGKVNTNNDADIRSILTPLAQLAAKYGVALICIRHLTKSGRDSPLMRGLGSIGYTGAARTVHLVGKNPQNESERVIICIKNNLAPDTPAIAFEITPDRQFHWKGETALTAADLFALAPETDDKTDLDDAKEFLESILADGPKAAGKTIKEARKAGIAERTLRRAREAMGIHPRKESDSWVWELSHTPHDTWPPWPSSEDADLEAENLKVANMANDSPSVPP